MRGVVFVGPSLPGSARPDAAGLTWRPPLRQGDLYRAALGRPALIGVVDGYFEVVPTVWHKEILWAMAQGIHVYGAASIGALRAAELAPFGMRGVGEIFRQFQAGLLADDDEVAISHAPEDIDYLPLAEAMVNVRANVARALDGKAVDGAGAAALIAAGKALFYKERTWDAVLAGALGQGLGSQAAARFQDWLLRSRVDQKRLDALAMVAAMRDHLERGVAPLQVAYEFAATFAWEEARRLAESHR